MSTWSVAGRSIAITGASGGIGQETALALSSQGAHMQLIGRSLSRHQSLIASITESGGSSEFFEADFGELSSVARAARSIATGDRFPTVLINNAGVTGRGQTKDGFDLAFGINHLSHYLLTRILLDRLVASAPTRIINVSSNAHYGLNEFRWSRAHQPRLSLTGFNLYRQSKAANIAFTAELSRRWCGAGVASVAIHPGVVATGLWRRIPAPFRGMVTSRMISPGQGARTTVDCALAPDLETGAYYTPAGIQAPAAYATDPETTAGLWDLSAELVGRWL